MRHKTIAPYTADTVQAASYSIADMPETHQQYGETVNVRFTGFSTNGSQVNVSENALTIDYANVDIYTAEGPLTLSIKYDNYPQEVTFSLAGIADCQYYYRVEGDGNDVGRTVNYTLSPANAGVYRLKLTDVGADGLNGTVTVTDAANNTLFSRNAKDLIVWDNYFNITVNGDVTYTAYFKAIGSNPDTNSGGGGETRGEFTATVVVDGTPYNGIALVSMGQSDNLFNLAVYIGESGPVFVTYILPRTGNQTINDGIQCFFYGSESDFVETSQGSIPPYLTVPSAGCTFDVSVTALDINAQTVTLSASGTMLDIAAAEAGQPRLVPFSVTMDGSFQYPGTPSK